MTAVFCKEGKRADLVLFDPDGDARSGHDSESLVAIQKGFAGFSSTAPRAISDGKTTGKRGGRVLRRGM